MIIKKIIIAIISFSLLSCTKEVVKYELRKDNKIIICEQLNKIKELKENIKKDDEIKRKDGYSCIKEETFNKLLLLLFEYNKLEKMIKVVAE